MHNHSKQYNNDICIDNFNLILTGWPHNKLLEKTIYLQVIDYDRFSRDDPIGETYIPLNEVDLSQSPIMWRYLQPCKDSRVRSLGGLKWMGDLEFIMLFVYLIDLELF